MANMDFLRGPWGHAKYSNICSGNRGNENVKTINKKEGGEQPSIEPMCAPPTVEIAKIFSTIEVLVNNLRLHTT